MLTDNLRLELQSTVAAVNRWAEKQCDTLDFHKLTYDKAIEEFECTMSALSKTNEELEHARPIQTQIKNTQSKELQAISDDITTLQQQQSKMSTMLSTLDIQEMELKQQLIEKNREFDTTKAASAKAQNDRKFGLSKFTTALGLRFEKAKHDSIKFIFTQLDPQSPTTECYFIIRVDDNDIYELIEMSTPTRDENNGIRAAAHVLLGELNDDNEIGKFTVGMRKLFQQEIMAGRR